MKNVSKLRIIVAFCIALAASFAMSNESVSIDSQTNVLELTTTNSAYLPGLGGSLSLEAQGSPRYGAPASAIWKSIVWQFHPPGSGISYMRVPISGNSNLNALSPGIAFLTDAQGSLFDNSGQVDLILRDGANNVQFAGTLFANTNVAEHTHTTVQPFLTSSTIGIYKVSLSGFAHHGSPSSPYHGAMLQFITPDGAIDYAPVMVGGSTEVFGRDVRVMITDTIGTLSDNSGVLTATLDPVPEPASLAALLMGSIAYMTARKKLSCK
ncbi:MAG: PEP-CTERM sorting domain-containing protein [Fimbriimonadaceae bacterium]|nr:PEP-CTERM sorting domain-containing protein [Fimbriimonadaceae bacterium]